MKLLLYLFARSAIENITDYGLKQQKSIFLVLETRSPRPALAGLISSKTTLLDFQMTAFLMCPHMDCILCLCTTGDSSSYKYSHILLELTHTISFNINYLFKCLISKHNHIIRYWGLGLPHENFGETQFSH